MKDLPLEKLCSVKEAAKFLGVSSTFLSELLQRNAMPFTGVEAYWRVRLTDLVVYKRVMEKESCEAMEELAAQAQELKMGY